MEDADGSPGNINRTSSSSSAPSLSISWVHCVPNMGENVPSVVLSSGWKMPMVALGTTTEPLPPPQVLTSTYLTAIEVGYRHFDTAALYNTEEPLGHAVAEALRRGLVCTRDDLFITSKLWCTDAHPDLVIPALKNTLRKLGLGYVDLYLIHSPTRLKKGEMVYPFNKEDILPFDMRGTWEAMEECSRLGLAKSIGVSNFDCEKLSQLLAHATIPPAVNQVKVNASWQERKLIEFCKEKGIHVCAWSPLGANGSWWGSNSVMNSPILNDIALAKGKTIAQVALRWIYEQGATAVVKSFNEGRMKENLQIFGWELSGEELNKISQSPQSRVFGSGKSFSLAKFLDWTNYPKRSLVELNVAWQQKKLIDFCKENGIHLCAWSPLGAYGTLRGSNAVALRWIYEQGVSVVVKSFNKGRMKENIQIFGWELSGEELNKISQILQQRVFPAEELFVSAKGPYKSLDELWDGEI
ncbi:hypothetical protein HHK36_006681 [Tetracentron sinense]|uniref:NADP-dependent oxidoreductase domain-containing protein n=1 Tax=Tetracentron sinense TaxID=13715 RepID=A0A834ZJF8_TETSI|nr:hypothetical protein HHK36_006681 [Tetracentron sinense]